MAHSPTRILSLFSGIGGLDLACTTAFPGSRVVVYVEREAYCCEILLRRMEERALDAAPVFAGSIRSFAGGEWRGQIDTVAAGFPCPPVSSAGLRRGTSDDRWLWPDVVRVVREAEPAWVILENVPGLRHANSGRAFGSLLGDLATLGFDAEWTSLSASDVGAPHLRERVFLLARRGGGVADAQRDGRGEVRTPRSYTEVKEPLRKSAERRATYSDVELEWPPGPEDPVAWGRVVAKRPDLAAASIESPLRELANGVPLPGVGGGTRVDTLRAYGNAVVPLAAATALRILHRRLTAEPSRVDT